MANNNQGCLTSIFPFLKVFIKEDEVNQELPYAKRDDFLSDSELSFYKVIRQAIDERIVICPKVGLKDIFFVKTGDRSNRTTYRNKIDRKHIDFLLCEVETMKPICGIELDDSSHQREDRKHRDRFVNKVFEVSGIQLIRFKNKKSYTLNEIRQQLNDVLNVESNNTDSIAKDTKQEKIGTPNCPKCNIPMIKRVVKKGNNKGREFWGCSNYPKCRHTIDI